MPQVTLDNQQLRLVVDPNQGVNVMAFYVRQRNSWLPVMPDVRAPGTDLKASSFVLIPYSNRIENGHFVFQGKDYQLANAEKHASHGDTRTRPWVVEEVSDTAVRCSFDSRAHEHFNWPWPLTAEIDYALRDHGLSSRITIWNRGTSTMPVGTGWHPYYNRSLTRPDEPVEVCFKVAGVYPDANDNRIPSGPPEPLAPNQDFSTTKVLTPDNFIDRCFYGYDGNGFMRWPESGVKVTYRCSATCTHLIFFNPPKPYFATEPVTNANNGVNLYAQGDPTSGIQLLAPGESLEATLEVQVEFS
jgi:aldose 1-epimerase